MQGSVTDYARGERTELEKLLSFIYSMQADPVNDDLKEEIKKFLDETGAPYYWAGDKEQLEWVEIIAKHFADWQRKQIMNEAIAAFIEKGSIRLHQWPLDEKYGKHHDNIKIIVFKEE